VAGCTISTEVPTTYQPGSIEVNGLFVVLKVRSEGNDPNLITPTSADSMVSDPQTDVSASGCVFSDISTSASADSSVSAAGHCSECKPEVQKYTFELKSITEDSENDDYCVDFDHFVVENKIYVKKAQFWEALFIKQHQNKLNESFSIWSGKCLSMYGRDNLQLDHTCEDYSCYLYVWPTPKRSTEDTAQKPDTNQEIECSKVTDDFKTAVTTIIDFLITKAREMYLIQYCKIFLTYFQILGAFWTFDVDWPDALIGTMKWASYIFQFDIFHAPNFSCFWAEAAFSTKLLAYTLLPFCACFILFAIPFGIYWYHKHLKSKNSDQQGTATKESKVIKERSMDLFWQATMVLIFFVYPVVSLTVLQAFDCRPGTDTAGNNGLDRLSVNIREKCPDPGSFVRVWAGIFILVYPIGLPVFVYWVMHRLRVKEIADHAVCSEIVISMIRECIQDCTTPEYSRLSTRWKSSNSMQWAEGANGFGSRISVFKFKLAVERG
jgi:hypothetical protein